MYNELQQILINESVTPLYQPIVDKYTGEIFAYEALSRGPSNSVLHSPLQLFEQAHQHNLLNEVEKLCRRQAIKGYVKQQLPGKLFINISPEALVHNNHEKGKTLELLNQLGLSTSQIVIELTEQYPGTDEKITLNALKYYQEMGFAIALDDLGAGYSSLRLWSQAKPEFVKIDRHFIENIDADTTKQEFVRSFVEIAQSMHCKVIAEGIETEAEFEYLCKLKIDYLQGYYFSRPQAVPPTSIRLNRSNRSIVDKADINARCLAVHTVHVADTENTAAVVQLFQNRPNINSIAVLNGKEITGIVYRAALLGLFSKPFGRDLYSKAPVKNVMERKPLMVDADLSIEQVSRLVTSRARYHQEDDFVICKQNIFIGIGHVVDLLRQITELQIKQARHANPLTQLPGLVPINDCMDKLIAKQVPFIVTHFDIDHFKPFNDVYGFAKGDEVILALGQSLQKFALDALDTVGHIGGDDFIVLWCSVDWQERVDRIVENFSEIVSTLYLPEHKEAGGFNCKDRYNCDRFVPLTTISVAALEIASPVVANAFEISSRLSPLKHAAKQWQGHALALNCAEEVCSLGGTDQNQHRCDSPALA